MSDWQPIETIPKDGTPVLVWLPVKMLNSHVHAATYHPNIAMIGGRFYFDATSEPTHWMPQPPEPTP